MSGPTRTVIVMFSKLASRLRGFDGRRGRIVACVRHRGRHRRLADLERDPVTGELHHDAAVPDRDDGAGRHQPVNLDTTLYLPKARARTTRCRRCCWRTASAAPRTAWPTTPRTSPTAGYAVLTWTARGLRPQRRRDPPGQPRLRGHATRSGCSTGSPPGPRSRTDARRRPAGRRRSAARTAARWRCMLAGAGHAGRRDRPDDHLERPGQRVPARVDRRGPGRRACSRSSWAGLFFGSGSGACRTGGRGDLAQRRRAEHRPARPADARPAVRAVRRRRLRRLPATSPPPARPTRPTIALLRRSSPAAVLDRIKAPTLLIQGAGRLAVPARPRPTPTPGASPRPARRCGSPGSPAATTAAPGPQSDQDRVQVPDRCSGSTTTCKGNGDGPGDRLHLLAGRRLRRARPRRWSTTGFSVDRRTPG